MAWLSGRPALYARLESEAGAARGTWIAGQPGSWQGDVENLDLTELPLSDAGDLRADGRIDARVDLSAFLALSNQVLGEVQHRLSVARGG